MPAWVEALHCCPLELHTMSGAHLCAQQRCDCLFPAAWVGRRVCRHQSAFSTLSLYRCTHVGAEDVTAPLPAHVYETSVFANANVTTLSPSHIGRPARHGRKSRRMCRSSAHSHGELLVAVLLTGS